MSRGLTSPQRAAAAASHRINVPCLELFFDSGTLRLAAGAYPIVDGSDTYIPTGPLLEIAPAQENSTGLQGLVFTLSGVDPAIIALSTSEPYRGRIVNLRKARYDVAAGSVIGSPTIEWVGRMGTMDTTEVNDKCTVQVSAEHYEMDLTRPAPRRWNDADQQRDFPGDLACQYAATMTEKYLPFPAKEALRK